MKSGAPLAEYVVAALFVPASVPLTYSRTPWATLHVSARCVQTPVAITGPVAPTSVVPLQTCPIACPAASKPMNGVHQPCPLACWLTCTRVPDDAAGLTHNRIDSAWLGMCACPSAVKPAACAYDAIPPVNEIAPDPTCPAT